MKRFIEKIPILLLAVLLCIATTGPVVAIGAETGISPHYDAISQIDAKLTISRSGKANCTASVSFPSSKYSITLTCELCDSKGGVIKSWSTSGKTLVTLDKSWYVTSGSDYQVVASATVYNSAGNYVDSGTAYSSVVPY